jgi:hypothetical protein
MLKMEMPVLYANHSRSNRALTEVHVREFLDREFRVLRAGLHREWVARIVDLRSAAVEQAASAGTGASCRHSGMRWKGSRNARWREPQVAFILRPLPI